MEKLYAVYIVTNAPRGVLYTGFTGDLPKRAYEHREGLIDGFTKEYGCKRLVWYETHSDPSEGIAREKRLKRWRRAWKIALVEAANPDWRDLFEELA